MILPHQRGNMAVIFRNAVFRTDAFNATCLGCHRDTTTNRDLGTFIGTFQKPIICSKGMFKIVLKYFWAAIWHRVLL